VTGGIYSDQRCPFCGSTLKDDRKSAVSCPNHPEVTAKRLRVKFRGVSRRFGSYAEANRFLTGLRFKTDEGIFDPREYRANDPLGFETLALKWLEIRRSEVECGGISPNTYRALEDGIHRGIAAFKQKPVNQFLLVDFQVFLLGLKLQSKSKHNYLETIKQFFRWVRTNKLIRELPEFPAVPFQLARRKTLDKDTQLRVLDEIRRISDFKTWLGIKFLATYINIRPDECRNIREGDIDLKQREIIIPRSKEKRSKLLYLIDEDVHILARLPVAIDKSLFFFRHANGKRFGKKHFYKVWKRACRNLKIDDVDLYGGTRHSSARALRRYYTPEQIRAASMHSTDRSFERYFWQEGDDLRKIYDTTLPGQKLAKDFWPIKKDN
jgi:integrase